MLVTCPSGLRGKVREWTVADEDVLVESMGLAAQGKMLQGLEALIRDSWVETIDPGPYGNMPSLDLDRVLSVDLLYTLVQTRMHTWGKDVLCDPPCPSGNHSAEGLADMSNCEVKKITAEVAAALRDNKFIDVELPRTGRRVGLRLMTRGVERELGETMVQFPKDRITRMLMTRVGHVEGFDPESGVDSETQVPLFEWFKTMPAADSKVLKGRLIEIDPSYDTEAMIKCGVCGTTTIAEITAQADFFAPTGRAETLKASYS